MDGAQVIDSPTLPGDLAACHAMIGQLLENLQNATRKLGQMEHQLQQLLRRLYGRSSEKIDPRQMALFAEMLKQIEAQAEPSAPDALDDHVQDAHAASKGHGRRKLAPDLPRQRVIHDLPEEEKPCPGCGTMRTVIGEETSEQLDYVPAQVTVIEHVRLKYICKACENNVAEGGPQIATATKPLSPIEKGLAAPGLLSHVIVAKYADSLPLHRLEKILARHDINIARSTMCDWMRQSAEALRPLHELMVKDVLASKVIHTDDTPVDVQDPRLGKTRQGRFWVYLGDQAHPQVVFDFIPHLIGEDEIRPHYRGVQILPVAKHVRGHNKSLDGLPRVPDGAVVPPLPAGNTVLGAHGASPRSIPIHLYIGCTGWQMMCFGLRNVDHPVAGAVNGI